MVRNRLRPSGHSDPRDRRQRLRFIMMRTPPLKHVAPSPGLFSWIIVSTEIVSGSPRWHGPGRRASPLPEWPEQLRPRACAFVHLLPQSQSAATYIKRPRHRQEDFPPRQSLRRERISSTSSSGCDRAASTRMSLIA